MIASSVRKISISAESGLSSASSPLSTVSSPINATSPTASTHIGNHPHLAIKPSIVNSGPSKATTSVASMSIASPGLQGPPKMPMSMTTKEWVIPPRPKPGRKPATDTPPTKRKAQNRAAQRAFRERRAARVGELEELLEESKAEQEAVERELRDKVHTLEVEAQSLRTQCQVLQNMLEREQAERRKATEEVESLKRKLATDLNHEVLPRRESQAHTSARSTPQPPSLSVNPTRSLSMGGIAAPRPSGRSLSISRIISPPDDLDSPMGLSCGSCRPDGPCACADEVLKNTADLSCGKCSIGTNCDCLDEAIRATAAPIITNDLKRPHRPSSPTSLPDEKRPRPDTMETDFTSIFSSKNRALPSLPQVDLVRPKDPCGFCKDGTYCMCAEAMMASAPTIPLSQQTQTPPPSENDVVPFPMEVTATGAIKLPSFQTLQRNASQARQAAAVSKPAGSSCGPGGPGTCAQCIADPKSGLFCRSLAANLERQTRDGTNSGSGGGCCGKGGPGGSCKGTTRKPILPPKKKQELGLSLSCAEAYKTLSGHRHFSKATDDIGSWLPQLRAAPRSDAGRSRERHPMEVEAASIMSVLKGFDVRFEE